MGQGGIYDRNKFDSMLAESAEEIGTFLYLGTSVYSISKNGMGQWELSYKQGKISAKFLVDATGRSSRFSSLVGARRIIVDKLVGIGGVLEPREDLIQDFFTLIEAVPNGWWYLAYVPSKHLVVWFFTDVDLCKKEKILLGNNWMERLEQTAYTRLRSSFNLKTKKLSVRLAYSSCLDRMVGKDWLAVGDSACSYDPLSSFGIQKGLHMGKKAASAILGHLREKNMYDLGEYEVEVNKGFSNYLQERMEYYKIEKRWKDSIFWKRRLSEV